MTVNCLEGVLPAPLADGGFRARVLLDSVNPAGSRLCTMELRYPRIIHSEFLTHRAFSRNSASSRAIPVAKMLRQIMEEPFIPRHWGRQQPGMQAEQELDARDADECEAAWLRARDACVQEARLMADLGLHKQVANRVVEPWMWITVIYSATNWANFFHLRCHPDAEPHFQLAARMALRLYRASVPRRLEWGEWHLPMLRPDDELQPAEQLSVSTGRCARVSYLTHDGRRAPEEDVQLHGRLQGSGHWSPFEHQAQASKDGLPHEGGNFGPGWRQYRKLHAGECVTQLPTGEVA